MKKAKTPRNHRNKVIMLSLFNVVMAILCMTTGTLAWFAANRAVEVSGASFKVLTPRTTDYTLYYLSEFIDNEGNKLDGNKNSLTNLYSGYEPNAFTKATFNEVLTNDATNVSQLWPKMRLTYAIIINSGSATRLSLKKWDEETLPGVVTSSQVEVESVMTNIPVSLTWAINIYGKSYNVTENNNRQVMLNEAFSQYAVDNSLTDQFNFSEQYLIDHSKLAADDNDKNNPIDIAPISMDEDKKTIVMFSIEFSNDSSTFYQKDNNGNWEKNTLGNSNCYEGLIFNILEFDIV